MRRAALVIVLLATVAADARGQDDDRVAELVLAFDRDGTGLIGLRVPDPRGGRLNPAAVSRGLFDAIPADWSNADRRRVGGLWVWWRPRWPTPPEKPAVRRLDLTPLLTALRGEGIASLRLRVAVNRYGDVSCNLPVRPASDWPHLVYRDDLATDQPAPPLEIRFGKRPTIPPRLIVARGGRWSLVLAALALVPVLLAAWRVRRMAASADTKRLGHALWRLHTHGPLATTFAWFVALGVTGGLALATGWLDGPRPAGWILRWLVLFALPPAVAVLLAARISRPAFERLRVDDWVGVETLETAPWVAVWRLVAVVLTASAEILLFDAYVSLAASTLVVAGTLALIAFTLGVQLYGRFVELPDAELAERVRSFANVLGVKVKAVGTIASATRRAEVIPMPNAVLTPPLLRDFARPAVDALVAQRFAVLARRGNFRFASELWIVFRFGSSLLAGAGCLAVIKYPDKFPAGVDWVPLMAAVGLGLFALPVRLAKRAKALAADGRAASLTDPETLVAAVAEQERRRGEPPHRPWLEDAFLFCPCAARRAAALARRYDWSRDDIARLLATPIGADPSRYAVTLPPIPERLRRNPYTAATIVSVVALSLAFAYAAEACPPGRPRAVALAAGILGVPLLYGMVLWLVDVRRNALGERELRDQLRAEGIDPAALSGVLVAFAPDREAHNYNGTPQWDLGYFVPAGNRLLFIGRRARAAVPWAAVEIAVMPWAGFGPSARVVVTWGGALAQGPSPVPDPNFTVPFDSSSPMSPHGAGAFSVWPARRAPWRFGRAAELRARLQAWRDGAVTTDPLPAAWANLPPPPPEPVGAKPFREALSVRAALVDIGILEGLVLMAAGSIGLPSRAAWYAQAVVIVTVLAYMLPPYLLSRRRRPPPG